MPANRSEFCPFAVCEVCKLIVGFMQGKLQRLTILEKFVAFLLEAFIFARLRQMFSMLDDVIAQVANALQVVIGYIQFKLVSYGCRYGDLDFDGTCHVCKYNI